MIAAEGERRFVAMIAAVGSALWLQGCSAAADSPQQESKAADETPRASFEYYYTWFAAGGAESSAFHGGTELTLVKGGMAAAMFENMPVFPGDRLNVAIQLDGKRGDRVTAVLQRHCDAENGEDATSESLVLSGDTQLMELEHTFEHFYSCWRLSFTTQSETAIKLRASDLKFVAVP
jgi:hypothetical protein